MAGHEELAGFGTEMVSMTTLRNDQAFLPQPEPGPPRKPWYRRAGMLISLVAIAVVATVVGAVLVVNVGDTTSDGTARRPAETTVQLHVTVTSALTGEPLAVTLTLPDGTTESAEAKSTVATVTTQLNTWAEEKNADAITNWVFSPATGLQFTPSTGVEHEGDVPWRAAFDVVGKNTTVDAVLLPGIIGEDEMVESMFGGNGTQVTLAEQPAWHGPVADGIVASVWIRSPLVITATGTKLSTTDAVLTAMIAAQPTR
jgi:hypothetical protein